MEIEEKSVGNVEILSLNYRLDAFVTVTVFIVLRGFRCMEVS